MCWGGDYFSLVVETSPGKISPEEDLRDFGPTPRDIRILKRLRKNAKRLLAKAPPPFSHQAPQALGYAPV